MPTPSPPTARAGTSPWGAGARRASAARADRRRRRKRRTRRWRCCPCSGRSRTTARPGSALRRRRPGLQGEVDVGHRVRGLQVVVLPAVDPTRDHRLAVDQEDLGVVPGEGGLGGRHGSDVEVDVSRVLAESGDEFVPVLRRHHVEVVDRGGADEDAHLELVAPRGRGLQTGDEGVLEGSVGERGQGRYVDGLLRLGDVLGHLREQAFGTGSPRAPGVTPAAGGLEQPVAPAGRRGVEGVAVGAFPHAPFQAG